MVVPVVKGLLMLLVAEILFTEELAADHLPLRTWQVLQFTAVLEVVASVLQMLH
jgi:hypothetical protein